MSKTLSKFMVLKASYNKKYLRFIIENGNEHGYLQFSGEALVSPYAKYEVVNANDGLVHIRCCYNNKYWVRSSSDKKLIVVGADEPQENKSEWSCTLFRPVYVANSSSTVRFIHVQLGNYVSFCKSASSPHYACLVAESATPDNDAYTFIDWETMLILPKQIAFKGNSCYLSARTINQNPYLQFVSSDIKDETVSNEVFILSDGSIRIKSNYFAKFWGRNSSNNWIWADSDDSTGNKDTLFWPTKVKDNVVALCNLGNNNFCTSKSLTTDKNCLNAAVPNSTSEENLVVEEVVTSRNISNVEFCLKDARIYCQKDITMASKVVENKTLQPCNMEVTLSYTDTKTGTWNGSVSLKLFVDITSIKSSIAIIDKVLEKSIVIISRSDDFNKSYIWGKPVNTSTKLVETKVTVLVPASKKMKVSIVATRGTCDVPFSYSQYDTLMNGDKITYNMDDGIYTDTNCFNFRTVTEII